MSGDENEEVQEVEDGIASSSNGPFKIKDRFGKMAITKEGDGLKLKRMLKYDIHSKRHSKV
jgi:hypothetical protein